MKTRAIVASVFLVANIIPQAMACGRPPGGLTGATVSTLLETAGRIACYKGSAPTWTNQEIHSSGTLRDYKLGPSSPTDPTARVGGYTIATTPAARNGIITYSYTGGPSFNYFIAPAPGTTAGQPGAYRFFPNANGVGSACTFEIPVTVETSASSGCA